MKEDIILVNTPINLTKEKLQEPIHTATVKNFRYCTNNTAPDYILQDTPYDFKETDDISYLVNNIHLLPLSAFRPG